MSKAEIEAQIANLQNSLRKITIKEQLDSLGLTKEEILEGLGVNQNENLTRFPYTKVVRLCTNYDNGNVVEIYTINQEKVFNIFIHLFNKVRIRSKVYWILFGDCLPIHTRNQMTVHEFVHSFDSEMRIQSFKNKAIEYCKKNESEFKDSISYLESI